MLQCLPAVSVDTDVWVSPSGLLAKIAGRKFAYRCKVFNSVSPMISAISIVGNVARSKNRATASCRKLRILLARVQYSQNIDHIGTDLIHHDVVRVHDVFTRASDAPGPE